MQEQIIVLVNDDMPDLAKWFQYLFPGQGGLKSGYEKIIV